MHHECYVNVLGLSKGVCPAKYNQYTCVCGDLASMGDRELSQMQQIPSRYKLELTATYNKTKYNTNMRSLDC